MNHLLNLNCMEVIVNSKYNNCREFLTQKNCLACPICLQELSLSDHSLKCVNTHNFNVSKKGTSSLLATGYFKMSKMYNYELFSKEENL